MCDAAKPRRANYVYPSKLRVADRTQWDYRIPNSKEYWQKVCEDVELKRRKVRYPSSKISHLFRHRNKSQNSNNSLSSNRSSENSLHEVSVEFTSPIRKNSHLTDLDSDTIDINKSQASSRAPKFKFASLQPSFSRTLLGDDENLTEQFSDNEEEVSQENQDISTEAAKIIDDKNQCPKRLEKKHHTKFSVRCAYKALKLLSSNKNLDFIPKPIIPTSDESKSSFTTDAVKAPDKSDMNITEEYRKTLQESFSFTKVHEKLKKSWQGNRDSKNIVLETSCLKLDRETSKSFSTSTRFTSGPSPKFVYPEPHECQAQKVLDSIPKLNTITRKVREKCLSCIKKSFEPESKKIISLPKTILYRSIFPITKHVPHSTEYSRESSTSNLTPSSTEDDSEDLSGTEITKSVTFAGYLGKFNSSNKITPIIPNHKTEVNTNLQQASFKDSKKYENLKYDQDKDTPTIPKKPQVLREDIFPSTEDPKICSSLEEDTSDDESQTILLIDDPSKSKFIAACHAPTVFCPSLEPLRALKQRQPTTLQARIALLEGTGGNRDDSSDDSVDETDLSRTASNLKSQKEIKSNDPSQFESVTDISLAQAIKLCLAKEEVASNRHSVLKETESQVDVQELPFPSNPSKFPSDLPLTSNLEILEVLRSLPEEDVTPVTILETLCKEFSFRAPKYVVHGRRDRNANARNKIAIKLVKLLVDSKRYLRPSQFSSDLVFSTSQPPLCNPRQLRRILPRPTYNIVAPLLGLPLRHPRRKTSSHSILSGPESSPTLRSSTTESIFSLEVHPPTSRSDVSSIGSKSKGHRNKKLNPYAMFLKKPRRKAVTWRPLTEQDLLGYDPEATLDSRAKYKMRQICKEFCDWFRSLGGTDAGIDEDVLQDMFEIDFNADVCKSLQVLIREMPTVPTEVALNRQCPEAGELAMTRTHLIGDAVAERTPAKVRAFGSSIPWELRHIPPRNAVQKRWLECEHVPRDLETMEVIWKGITHLESVRSFVQWVKDNPEIPIPKALDAIIAMDISGLGHAEDDEALAQRELDIEQIESFKIR